MIGLVTGSFNLKEYLVPKPQNLIKLQMSVNLVTTSANSVYAYCDFSHLWSQISMYTDYTNPEQYIQIASRVGGSFIQTIPSYMSCISQGKVAGNGFDVGKCYGGIFGTIMDTTL